MIRVPVPVRRAVVAAVIGAFTLYGAFAVRFAESHTPTISVVEQPSIIIPDMQAPAVEEPQAVEPAPATTPETAPFTPTAPGNLLAEGVVAVLGDQVEFVAQTGVTQYPSPGDKVRQPFDAAAPVGTTRDVPVGAAVFVIEVVESGDGYTTWVIK